ncbi:MAG: ABC transporter ATP-binding protein [Alphaproteobacteria bacterium]|uniref:ABC transporter ATP-binding protein n=1 Tax=Candidatus Nitrobium versatile TaxID=2884831 RepID=A0A953SGI4_9BACT|nr:ABC transporter ATP-binding protein [Candidatus Nitrobium versatile]
MIRLEGVEKSYGHTKVLNGITFEVKSGEFISVMGSSGSGKSTLLNLIGGMDRPDRGVIWVKGENITSYSDEQLTLYRREKIGFVFQFFNLLPAITVYENIQMPLLLNGIEDRRKVLDLIRRVGLEGREDDYPHQLSGGQQQRVAIARALVHDPEIILADEPTGSLDSQTGGIIMGLLKRLVEEAGKTVVLVTHEYSVAKYAHRRIRIRDGVVS